MKIMMKVKYIRVSTLEQNTVRQEVNSKEFEKIYADKVSGAVKFSDRKEGKKLIDDVEKGKIGEIHVAAVDRLGRNIIDILTVVDLFNKNNIRLFVEDIAMYSMIDNKINPAFNMIICILGNVANLERESLLARQKQGIEIAKAQNKYRGRLYGSRMSDSEFLLKYKTVVKELKKGQSLRRSAKIGNCSLGTAQKVQKLISK